MFKSNSLQIEIDKDCLIENPTSPQLAVVPLWQKWYPLNFALYTCDNLSFGFAHSNDIR